MYLRIIHVSEYTCFISSIVLIEITLRLIVNKYFSNTTEIKSL